MIKYLIITAVVSISISFTTFGQTSPGCINDGPNANCKDFAIRAGSGVGTTSQLGGDINNTSPSPVPKISDRRFVRNGVPNELDTWKCGLGSTISVDIPIDRVITTIDRVANPAAYYSFLDLHKQRGYISPIKIKIPVYDIDPQTGSTPREIDKLYLNGHPIGELYGGASEWVLNEFVITDLQLIQFGKFRGFDTAPEAGVNNLTIEIDTGNSGWCTSIDWISIEFNTLSPIALIHGNGSNAAFYTRRGFVDTLNAEKLLYDDHLNMPTNYIENSQYAINGRPNNARIRTYLYTLKRSYGVDSMHLVLHSKGGLDSRSYLANWYNEDKEFFNIVSYTSLSTPHLGSVLANLAQKNDEAIKYSNRVEYPGFPTFTGLLSSFNKFNIGQENLTTDFVQGFNARNLPRLREVAGDIDFYTIAADADKNEDTELTMTSSSGVCEQRGTIPEGTSQYWLPECFIAPGPDIVYKILRGTQAVELNYQDTIEISDPQTGNLRTIRVARVTAVPNPQANVLNDTLVTRASGMAEGTSLYPMVKARRFYLGQFEGRNHATIADGTVANQVLAWILSSEAAKGDLKPLP